MTHMRYWAMTFAVAIGGAFLAIERFAFAPTSAVWIAFGVAAGAATIGLGLLVDGLLDVQRTNITVPRTIEILLTAATVAVAAALLVLTAVQGVGNLRWWTFGLGAGLAGVSLVASIVHELSSERVRHELEVAQTTVAELAMTVR